MIHDDRSVVQRLFAALKVARRSTFQGITLVNAIIHNINEAQKPANSSDQCPSDDDIESALRGVLRWIGEDPNRDGLIETPSRVVRAFREYFSGYKDDPKAILSKTFEEIDGYDEMVSLRGIPFHSHCEHHMAPIVGRAWVAYVPNQRVVGISKLARLVEVYARRLQIQERMTAQIANTIEAVLQPKGVAVMIRAAHHCMTARGVNKEATDLVTSRMLGCFKQNAMSRQEFLSIVGSGVADPR